ncbi:hypothetical protein BDV96DRAFT_275024 [Lophiotrema nucula]|uniref:Uncharacterized protein n=1 Tax=Lophiotrema nucula TaxID=690887 RepID=A0A6A5ZR60_9PLEO|nr:hypothetical protein BDV96DRAFT_275024 [Lophiotrema nucula]
MVSFSLAARHALPPRLWRLFPTKPPYIPTSFVLSAYRGFALHFPSDAGSCREYAHIDIDKARLAYPAQPTDSKVPWLTRALGKSRAGSPIPTTLVNIPLPRKDLASHARLPFLSRSTLSTICRGLDRMFPTWLYICASLCRSVRSVSSCFSMCITAKAQHWTLVLHGSQALGSTVGLSTSPCGSELGLTI